jgi:hypothetical protein
MIEEANALLRGDTDFIVGWLARPSFRSLARYCLIISIGFGCLWFDTWIMARWRTGLKRCVEPISRRDRTADYADDTDIPESRNLIVHFYPAFSVVCFLLWRMW